MRELARYLQGRDIDRVLASGGVKHSGWRVVGIGLLSLVGFVAVGAAVFLAVNRE